MIFEVPVIIIFGLLFLSTVWSNRTRSASFAALLWGGAGTAAIRLLAYPSNDFTTIAGIGLMFWIIVIGVPLVAIAALANHRATKPPAKP